MSTRIEDSGDSMFVSPHPYNPTPQPKPMTPILPPDKLREILEECQSFIDDDDLQYTARLKASQGIGSEVTPHGAQYIRERIYWLTTVPDLSAGEGHE